MEHLRLIGIHNESSILYKLSHDTTLFFLEFFLDLVKESPGLVQFLVDSNLWHVSLL